MTAAREALKFTLPVTVGRISMHVDRTVSITCRSEKEISDTDFAIIHQAFQKLGRFVFSETNVDEADIPTEDVDRDVKSQAPLLRGRCFRFVFSETNVDEADIPTEDVDRDVKSQAQLIRGRCFRLHKLREEAGQDSDYDALYRKATNWLIAKLDKQIAEFD